MVVNICDGKVFINLVNFFFMCELEFILIFIFYKLLCIFGIYNYVGIKDVKYIKLFCCVDKICVVVNNNYVIICYFI